MNNYWNLLLKALDRAFGSPDLTTSRLKTLKQTYDNQRQEHQVHLIYAYRRGSSLPSVNREYRKRVEELAQQPHQTGTQQAGQEAYSLLKTLNDSVAYQAKTDYLKRRG